MFLFRKTVSRNGNVTFLGKISLNDSSGDGTAGADPVLFTSFFNLKSSEKYGKSQMTYARSASADVPPAALFHTVWFIALVHHH